MVIRWYGFSLPRRPRSAVIEIASVAPVCSRWVPGCANMPVCSLFDGEMMVAAMVMVRWAGCQLSSSAIFRKFQIMSLSHENLKDIAWNLVRNIRNMRLSAVRICRINANIRERGQALSFLVWICFICDASIFVIISLLHSRNFLLSPPLIPSNSSLFESSSENVRGMSSYLSLVGCVRCKYQSHHSSKQRYPRPRSYRRCRRCPTWFNLQGRGRWEHNQPEIYVPG